MNFMKVRELFKHIRSKLGQQGDFLGAELLLAYVLDKDRAYLQAHDDEEIPQESMRRYDELFGRMAAGEPVAYLLGHREFYGLNFFVDRRVLIPRPETEHLVEKVLDYCRKNTDVLKILDLGTGSGCIALSLAKLLPSTHVTATDISEDALNVARINAQRLDLKNRVSLLQSDLLESVSGPFDVIVANLPYIGEKRFSFVSKSAYDYEPHVALFGGNEGLSLYRRFFEELSRISWRPRLLVGEFGFLQKEELLAIFQSIFPEISMHFEQDYAHIDRMFVVEFPSIP